MSKEFKEIRRRLSGSEADPYIGLGRKMLGAMKEIMKLGGLSQLVSTKDLANGVRITVMSVFGQDEVRISVPAVFGGEKKKSIKVEDRTIIVGRCYTSRTLVYGDNMAVRWENDVPEALGIPADQGLQKNFGSRALAISSDPDNEVIVGELDGWNYADNAPSGVPQNRAFRWTRSEGIKILPGIVFPALSNYDIRTTARAISADGTVIVGISNSFPIMWDKDLKGTRFLDGRVGDAFGVSGDGTTIVGEWQDQDTGDTFAYKWDATAGFVQINDDAGSRATCCSLDGSIIYGRSGNNGGYQMFRWTKETGAVAIQTASKDDGYFYATDDSGDVAVGLDNDGLKFTFKVGANKALIWTQENGLEYFVDHIGTNSRGSVAFGVSEDGGVVVGATYPEVVSVSGVSPQPGPAFYWTRSGQITILPMLDGFAGAEATDVTHKHTYEETEE